jgi:hypothetical protein
MPHSATIENWISIKSLIDGDMLRLGVGVTLLFYFGACTLRRKPAPQSWLVASVLLLTLLPMLFPQMWGTAWRDANIISGFEKRLDALLSGVFGTAMAIVIARLVSPQLFGNYDQKLLARDAVTTQVRHWIGSMAVAGAWLGWQAMTALGCLIGLIAIAMSLATRPWKSELAWNEWNVWIGPATIVMLGVSSSLSGRLPECAWISPVIGHTLAGFCIYGLGVIWRILQPKKTHSHPEDED